MNALAAYLADRLETAFVVEDVLAVQIDLDFVDPVAKCWGRPTARRKPRSTRSATLSEAFLEDAMKRTEAPDG